ncbi:hypothetical protein A3C09_04100 [Candidatus Uhrbacteria bacterium RIFCSPHIGHO2_02_FULL_47_44]|uniref:SMB domain-containing protein n=1 Tax=Candidatus Uhrbacteria bacterium RIFCSPLOWO2_02_FULL_48_18 TaxID=1802408 RepID=A0A1F7V8W4_9BACT|nr:MAG: hypothetical protein A2839_01855 [Candidatus Uhrbacteria bacterium RIFCSPHIGHO2_01_FULL_47_10]OGL71091.1 MAG: hypothetical protein A3C09_04100 [Candidatus Uhrbacteria bacterium RIFCSPHIGHO2_02_FULL_47_44]OGL80800.1 MAG: hypothetical protein A3B20_05470 [Candidatus Uhrbacteria bacterium RIFCSPLOWO2_01_FULL_47_17]OGL86547.1 MAG: hypothetical protein A3I41_04635 [Candidatus Uhrbacteria bacterium RIFCSPLOWO2_02_FULL_48_18]OGL92811.1 MAG: hypothetical protein A3H12_02835 [Candidatus Uhrbacte
MRNVFLCAILALGLVACTPSHIDLNDDAGDTADSTASDSSGREDAKPDVSGTSCLSRCGDYNDKAACQCDEKCVAQGDCCGDFIKQCLVEVKPDADAGSKSPEVAQNNCVDNDGDGYCATGPQPGDCNDNPTTGKNINPGAAEKCGDNVDNNCNGHVDEACAAPAPASGTATVKITYPTVRFQQLLVHVWGGSKAFIFSGYEKVVNDTASVFQATVTVDENACGLTIQSANGPTPATSSFWLCTGSGGPSSIDPAATIEVTYNGKTYTKSDVTALGAPNGVGCAIVVQFKTAAPCNL